MAASVVTTVTTLSTTVPSVPVTARCAPTTSEFSRALRLPVCEFVKNASGICWMWS